MSGMSIATPRLRAGDTRDGFVVNAVLPMPAQRLIVYDCTHIRSGARLVHLHADEPENYLTVLVRTPPTDNTGVAHVLEHAVLSGSRKYPVKELFAELLKTSIATRLNGYTCADHTGFPLASMNRKDFFNLADVYCDVVFQPLLTEKMFQQEAHHYVLHATGGTPRLDIEGVVYSEMKGAYSSLDDLVWTETARTLLCGNAYGYDNGGHPDAIPDLTYTRFCDFHRGYYHPSNTCLMLFGDIPTEDHLRFFNGTCLQNFTRCNVDARIQPQPRWRAPRRCTIPYAIAHDEASCGKAAVVYACFTNDVTDAHTRVALAVLATYLGGHSGAPLQQALLESRLGAEMAPTLYAAHRRDAYFATGLYGTESERAPAIEALIRETFSREARNGLKRDSVAAAFHQIELQTSEAQCSSPSWLMGLAGDGWLYAESPFHFLDHDRVLAAVHRRWETEPRFFETLLQTLFVDNPHYCVLTFVPDANHAQCQQAAFAARMEKIACQKSQSELADIARSAVELETWQTAPNPPETLATLPRLSLQDVAVAPSELTVTTTTCNAGEVLTVDMATNGLTYLALAFDLSGLPEDLFDPLRVYADVLTRMGTAKEHYATLAAREASICSGLSIDICMLDRVGEPWRVQPHLLVVCHAVARNTPAMLDIIRTRLHECDFRDRERLRDVILQQRTGWNNSLTSQCGSYAHLQAQRTLSRNTWLQSRCSGLPAINLYQRLADTFDQRCDEIIAGLERVRDFIVNNSRLLAGAAGEPMQVAAVRDWIGTHAPTGNATAPEHAHQPPAITVRDGIFLPVTVAANVMTARVDGLTLEDRAALMLLQTHLTYGFLWNEVRLKGNAYNVGMELNAIDDIVTLNSGEDPHIAETLAVFRTVPQYIEQEMDLSSTALEQAIIATVGRMDTPIRGSARVTRAIMRRLCGVTPQYRAAVRARVLQVSKADVLRVNASVLAPALTDAHVCVIANDAMLATANNALAAAPLTLLTPAEAGAIAAV